jgi:predicted phage terminase large subunit-like protein
MTTNQQTSNYTPTQRAAALLLATLKHKPETSSTKFSAFLKKVSPTWNWNWPYIRYIINILTSAVSKPNKIMIFCPPRHGKSELVTVRYAVWRLSLGTPTRVIIGAYSQALANTFSRKAHKIAETAGLSISKRRDSVDDWRLDDDESGYRSVGVGGSITGQGGDLIILDDPIKSREEASSEVYRERVFDWYSSDVFTRLEPNGSIIIINTRWHEADLCGKILESEDGPNWRVISFPAEAEEDDILGRKLGEPLCPARFDKAALADRKNVLGELIYTSLYQQRPTPASGAVVKREWFEIIPVKPVARHYVRYWDLAATLKSAKSSNPDYMVGVLMAITENKTYAIMDVIRERVDASAVLAIMKQTAEADGHDVTVGFEKEPSAAAKIAASSIVTHLAGFTISGVLPRGDKIQRLMPFLSQAKVGNVKLIKGNWNSVWLSEMAAFPLAEHDDIVDATSGAFSLLTTGGGWSRSPSS